MLDDREAQSLTRSVEGGDVQVVVWKVMIGPWRGRRSIQEAIVTIEGGQAANQDEAIFLTLEREAVKQEAFIKAVKLQPCCGGII